MDTKRSVEVLSRISERSTGDLAVGKSFFWMVWSGAISIANSVVLWIAMARSRDVDEVGRFAIVLGIYALFVGICSLGLVPHFVTEISKRRASTDPRGSLRDYISSAAVFVSGSGLASAVMMTLVGFYATESADARLAVFILSFAMIPMGMITLAEAAAVAHGSTRLIAMVTTTENIVRTIVPLILILQGYGLPAICVSLVIVRFLALAAYLIPGRSMMSRYCIRSGELRMIARLAPTFAGTVVAASVMWQGPAVLLGRFSSELETAKYGTASRFMIPASILLASYADVIQPHFTRYAHDSFKRLGRYIRRIAFIPAIVAIAGMILSPFAASFVLTTLFGGHYGEAASTLEIFAACLIPYTLIMIMARGLVAMGAQRIDLYANLVGVAVFLLAGWMLVPEYGAVGAAASQLLGFVTMAFIEIAAVVWLINNAPSDNDRPPICVSAPERVSDWKLPGILHFQKRQRDC